jgi:MFS family permease
MIVGPVIAGLLLGSYGPAIVYVINALSYLAVIAGVLMLDTSGDVEGAADKGISMHAFKEGLSFVWSTPVIVQSMVLDFAATFFGSATALLPIFAAEVLMVGPRGLGWLSAAPAVGAVLAGLSMARFGPFRRQGVIVIFAVAVYGLATVGFGLSKVFWVSLLMLALTGAADTVSTVIRQTIRQLLTPDRLRGRMTSINMIFFMGGPQLGELEAGVLAEFIGAARAVVFGGLGCLVTVILAAMKSKHLIAYQWKGREENE